MPFKYESLRARLDANSVTGVTLYAGEPCRIWTGSLAGGVNGRYGKISIRATRKPKGAKVKPVKSRLVHRVSYAESAGVPLWRVNHVLHGCNVPTCINPAHLRSSTQRANVRQCVTEGRHRNSYGPRADTGKGALIGKREARA